MNYSEREERILDEILQSLANGTLTTVSMQTAFLFVLAAGIMGLLISLTYLKTGEEPSKNFARTLIILPMLVSVVIASIGSMTQLRFRLPVQARCITIPIV